MKNLLNYLTLNWSEDFTCWHFVQKIYREEFGIEIPPYEITVFTMVKEASGLMKGFLATPLWIPTETPNANDLCVIGRAGMVYHVGIMIDARAVLHLPRNSQSQTQKITSFSKSNSLTFYRHAALY